jgi:hypothetical protein
VALNHSNLLKLFLLELSHSKLATAWQNDTGMARSFDTNRVVKFGLKGSSDVIGITRDGRFLAIEIKVGKDFLKPEQIAFKLMVEKNNGLHFIIRNEDQIKDIINDIKNRV